jgi:hypothetical protein
MDVYVIATITTFKRRRQQQRNRHFLYVALIKWANIITPIIQGVDVMKRLDMRFSPSLCYILILLQKRKEICRVSVVTITTSVKFTFLTYVKFLKIIGHVSHRLKWSINTIHSAWKHPTFYYNIPLQHTCLE